MSVVTFVDSAGNPQSIPSASEVAILGSVPGCGFQISVTVSSTPTLYCIQPQSLSYDTGSGAIVSSGNNSSASVNLSSAPSDSSLPSTYQHIQTYCLYSLQYGAILYCVLFGIGIIHNYLRSKL